ncbi:MAG: hypothetical protein VR67_03120 [Peptococcaceae bacterium BRH_c8a]|nr:MAG: hypothetical protein VR67_03120 [Peptococcaceae bacterium BRH_c8a]
MSLLSAIKEGIQRSTYYVFVVGMFFLVPLMFLTTIDVITRGLFSWPISGAVELSNYMLSIIILTGIAYTHQKKEHATVTFITVKLPHRVQAFLTIITTVFSMFVALVLSWRGWVMASGAQGAITSDVLRIPQFPFLFMITVAGILLFLELLIDFLSSVNCLFKGQPNS